MFSFLPLINEEGTTRGVTLTACGAT
jgi:hypothetical protein